MMRALLDGTFCPGEEQLRGEVAPYSLLQPPQPMTIRRSP
jgi:hypothetical protein